MIFKTKLEIAFFSKSLRFWSFIASLSPPTSLKSWKKIQFFNSINLIQRIKFSGFSKSMMKSQNAQMKMYFLFIVQKLIQSIVSATIEESAEELLETYQDQKLDALSILRCRRVKIEGNEFGQFVLLKNKAKYYPLINSPDNESIEFIYREIKFMTRYRYLF